MYLFVITNTNGSMIYIVADSMESAIVYYNSKKVLYDIKSIERSFRVELSNLKKK